MSRREDRVRQQKVAEQIQRSREITGEAQVQPLAVPVPVPSRDRMVEMRRGGGFGGVRPGGSETPQGGDRFSQERRRQFGGTRPS